ncbi:hypothetical protein CLF_109433 [Clonorchis sinensis]|uniref:Peptidase M13 N-terminal domain-containing protein n=1 Tax=Clonorchis sinensis TaxID=79923 RepID=G7YSL6_CLOSI|nr:hypothetical protein CLF_109433 [Clonorchis sinensis]
MGVKLDSTEVLFGPSRLGVRRSTVDILDVQNVCLKAASKRMFRSSLLKTESKFSACFGTMSPCKFPWQALHDVANGSVFEDFRSIRVQVEHKNSRWMYPVKKVISDRFKARVFLKDECCSEANNSVNRLRGICAVKGLMCMWRKDVLSRTVCYDVFYNANASNLPVFDIPLQEPLQGPLEIVLSRCSSLYYLVTNNAESKGVNRIPPINAAENNFCSEHVNQLSVNEATLITLHLTNANKLFYRIIISAANEMMGLPVRLREGVKEAISNTLADAFQVLIKTERLLQLAGAGIYQVWVVFPAANRLSVHLLTEIGVRLANVWSHRQRVVEPIKPPNRTHIDHTDSPEGNSCPEPKCLTRHVLKRSVRNNVLINVQLELRVPLFFSAWIKKTYNPGLLETRMPYLDMLIQPELPSLEELESMQRDTRHRRPGRWTEFLVYVNTLLSTVTGHQTEEPNLSSKLLKSKNISYIPKAISVLYKLRLVSFSTQHQRNQESKVTPVRMTVRELMQKTQQSISFPRYLGAIMAANRSGVIPRDLAVWVADVEYYERLGNLLYHTSFNELQEYITFCILHKYAPYVYRPLAILKRKLLEPLAVTETVTVRTNLLKNLLLERQTFACRPVQYDYEIPIEGCLSRVHPGSVSTAAELSLSLRIHTDKKSPQKTPNRKHLLQRRKPDDQGPKGDHNCFSPLQKTTSHKAWAHSQMDIIFYGYAKLI